ncbi:uncharacterized protein THITE_2133236 [Thermothielavioides terrestris NRRL 8126]|uniref:Uncharacterized protein n=1 Tax=Thermothielavioides terrestris (strain ATCC 38088 / NRRL 8126) TaxID=578455 RepID=G2RGX3_THETT|nr:uncharacterized protein THITE_2133236 [Thermothielavioides terrestris NRRL 8126]AEO71958.1 hypothetical protein THITE_2133236 [Thermothielavioides terrestris NRRL 8126]
MAYHYAFFDADDRDGQLATEEEIWDLLYVIDGTPARVWLAMLMRVAERFTWCGNTGPLQSYLQQSPDSSIRGALGLSQATASNLDSAILAASDFTLRQRLYMRILGLAATGPWFCSTHSPSRTVLASSVVLFVTSLPQMLDRGAAEWAVYTAMALMSLGSGGGKVVFTPLVGLSTALATTLLERYVSFWAAYLAVPTMR